MHGFMPVAYSTHAFGKGPDKRAFLKYNENMKTSRFLIALLVCFGFFACTPPEEEVHPKRRSARADNLQRYMNKAQHHRALAQARAKAIVKGPLVEGNALKEFLPKMPDLRISSQIFAQKNALQNEVRQAHARRAAQKAGELLAQFREEAMAAALAAQTPQELATKLDETTALYAQKIAAFSKNQQAASWALPDEEQSLLSRQTLQDAVDGLTEGSERDYGSACAQKAQPVLHKAADDYWLALSSVSDPQEMEQELTRVGNEADDAFRSIVAEYGDPVITVSDEEAASLRARLIAAHQEIENQFDKLYGKEAVLKTRDIFERYRDEADQIVRRAARLSQMQNDLNKAGEKYRKEMTELQVHLNENLERRAAEVRGIPVSAVRK